MTAAQAGPAGSGRLIRRLPVGVEPRGRGAHARVWAPMARRVAVVLEDGEETALAAEAGGYFAGTVPNFGHGDRYRFRLDDGEPRPDPASRWQPEGPLGSSAMVDPGRYTWRDVGWRGLDRRGQVLYELHVGAFTPEGTWRAAAARLPHLAGVGITAVEMMPVGEFPGRFGWGYDSVDLFAPSHLYGEPDDLRFFVDEAHRHGIGVILDVVYNHLGPVGNFLKEFSPRYFSDRYCTDWGEALNFDDEASGPVREFIVANGTYWTDEFHIDGFRIDATQNIYDFGEGHEHILAEFTRRAREAAASRRILVVGENEPQAVRLIRPRERGGLGLDALWNDDFHHSAVVALTGRNEAYLSDHQGRPQELVSAAKYGFLYQGQRYRWQKQARGTPALDLEPERLVVFIENHDQLANTGRGFRLHRTAAPGCLRAVTALLLLGPATPMLFMGQEFAASSPFLYFAGFEGELAELVDQGRRKEASQFPSLGTPELQAVIRRPDDPRTFAACKLDWGEVGTGPHAEALALHRDLLRLRREDGALVASRRPGGIDGAVLGPEAFVLRFFGGEHGDRLLLVNLGVDLELGVRPEPLLAPPEGHDWEQQWTSEHPAYGGAGSRRPSPDAPWVLPGRAAILLRPGPPSPERNTEEEKALAKAAEMRAKAKARKEEGG